MEQPIGVVVPVHNELSKGYIGPQLAYFHAMASKPMYSVVLVDDGSSDGTRQSIEQYKDSHNSQFLLVLRSNNGQKVEAIKDGLEVLADDVLYVLLLDFDTRLVVDCDELLPSVSSNFGSNPKLAAIILRLTPRPGNWLVGLQRYDYRVGRFIHRFLSREKATICISGAASLWQRRILQTILEAHSGRHNGDDLELTILTFKAGYGVEYCPKLIAETGVPESYGPLFRQRIRWFVGAAQTLEKEKMFCWRRIAEIRKSKLYGLVILWQWCCWASIFPVTVALWQVAFHHNWTLFMAMYLVVLCIDGLILISARSEIESPVADLLLYPAMPFFRLTLFFPALIVGSVLYAGTKLAAVSSDST